MKFLICIFLFIIKGTAYGQEVNKIIAGIQEVQKNLHFLSYSLQRADTFVTGTTRIISGQAILKLLPHDRPFGFSFWGKRADLNRFALYDGTMGYDVNNDTRTYDIRTGTSVPHILGALGGQMVVEDLGKLDTAGAMGYELTEDKEFFYLTLHYPDLKEYDVTHRRKTLTVDKKRMLPVGVSKYQETFGKVQHLNYAVRELKLNEEALVYDFSTKPFLETYAQELPQINKALQSLNGKEAPPFELISFSGESVSSASLRGKVVLLDFWEVWCGPCVASMPKVEALYNRYKGKGLLAYGIMSEKPQLEPAKLLVAKSGVSFPMLVGDAAVQKSYKLNAVPLYILIDREGKIRFISEGYAEVVEEAVQKALAE